MSDRRLDSGEGDEASTEELQRMTLLEHLDELRKRILWSVIVLVVGFGVCFSFAKYIYRVLALPVEPYLAGGKLSYLHPTDPFLAYVKVSLLTAVFLTSPFLIFQLWRFVAPGMYRREKRYALPFIFFGSTFFIAGGLFGYLVAFPFALKFLIGIGSDFEAVITIDYYLSFLITILLGLGVIFELPILIFMLSAIGVVTPQGLMRHFRWAVMIIFVIAAVITPTADPINLCIVAVPTIVLYLLGVLAAWVAQRAQRRREAAAEAEATG